MNYVGKLLSNFKGFYNEINSATLTGAIDIVIVQQEDGSYLTSPWHVRFGKLGVLRSREKVVDIEINGIPADIQMKLGDAGEAFFVEEATDTDEVPAHLATSPLPDVLELMQRGLKELHDEASGIDLGPQPTIITIHPDPTPTDVPPGALGGAGPLRGAGSRPGGPFLDDNLGDVDATPSDPSRSLLEELKIVIDDAADDGANPDNSASAAHFRPVSMKEKVTLDTGIQTDMSGAEVETKTRLDDSCRSCDSSNCEQQTQNIDSNHGNKIPNIDSNKIPSFIRLESETNNVNRKPKEKRKHRRKRSPSNIHGLPKNTSQPRNAQLDVMSAESCGSSSCDIQEETLFDLELSGDEVDQALLMTTMGRTVSMPLIDHKHARTDEWASSQYAAALHPFSDGDITPLVSPVGSRPPTPKSDTEYETLSKYDATSQTQLTGDDLVTIDGVRWRWGELPENCESEDKTEIRELSENREEEKPSGGLFQFMRKTKKIRHQPEQEGIYLDDLNLTEMDPEVAALYLYQTKSNNQIRHAAHDEDGESGRGASLPQSPLTVEGCSPLSISSTCMSELSLSLCGGLKEADGLVPHERFLQFLVTYDEFCENPSIMADSKLVIKMGEKYYNWQVAGPVLMSVLAFRRPLPESAVEALVKQYMPKKETQRRRGWMWWGRSTGGTDSKDQKDKPLVNNASSAPSSPQKPNKADKKSKRRVKSDASSDDESDTSTCSEPKPLIINGNIPTETVSVATQMSPPVTTWQKEFCRKSLKLSTEKIDKLSLNPGVNEVSFSVTTQYQGTSRCTAFIYLWKWDDRIIISDIDGTITKSDVLGHVLPMIGKDWSQVGIANLYSQIEKNGYKFLYLSARAIGQSKITRDYLKSIRQGSLCLPDGPLLLSPSSLISAFHKEVIERRPQDFKISCLRDIKALFAPTRNPFHSGFGNKINDVWSYQAVNIPISRIFTVNHRGELKHEMTCTFQSTYTKMTDTVDHLFPPLEHHPELGMIASGKFHAPDQYSTFTYWRDPLPDIEKDLEIVIGKK